MVNQTSGFTKDFTETSFWKKVKQFAGVAGKEVVEMALQLYYALQSPDTPAWSKTVIIGALGYFISPIDAISDFIPMVGYADDLGVLAAAIATVRTHITDDMRAKATAKWHQWFH